MQAGDLSAVSDMHRWHLIGPAAATMGLSRMEAVRLRELMQRIKDMQEADKAHKVGWGGWGMWFGWVLVVSDSFQLLGSW